MAVKESDVMKLKRAIKENKIKGAYLFYGDEIYLRDIYIAKFRALIPENGFEEFNLIEIDGRNMSFDEAADAIESFPVSGDIKLGIIRDSGIFKKPKEEQVKFWNNQIKKLPDYCILLLIEDAVDKRSSVYKTISSEGCAVEFAHLKPYEITAWVQQEVLKSKRKMSKEVIEYFISVCQAGLSNLKNELDKLFDYCGEEITITDIQRVVSKPTDVQVFALSDCILEKNTDGALEVLEELNAVKESACNVLYLLLSAFEKMYLSKLMLAEGMPQDVVEKRLGVPPFIAKKYIAGGKKYSEAFLKNRITRVPEIDLSIKQGKISEWDALYEYVLDSLATQ